jgi:hypothetical protein
LPAKTDVAPFKHGQLYVGEKPNYDNMDPVTYHQRSEVKSDSAIGFVICDLLRLTIHFKSLKGMVKKLSGIEVLLTLVDLEGKVRGQIG